MSVDPSDPRSVDEEFRFKQIRQLRIFDGTLTPTANPTNLLAVSNKFGLVFVGSNKGIRAIKTVDVQKLDDGKFSQSNAAVDYPYKEVSIPYKISHIALSSDDLTLAACLQIYKSPCAHLYDVRAFADNVDKIEPFVEVRLSAAENTEVVDYAWNPAIPTLFAVCLCDGSLTIFDIMEAPSSFKVLGNLPSSIEATSICWSPKGKQIVVGKQNGSMVQFKQDLQATNSVPAPTGLSENPTPVMSICWISNFLFAVSYQCDDRVVLVFVHSKGGQTNFVNYDDLFYASSNERRPYYYMFHQPDWHIVMCASSNASEVVVIGNKADDKEAWVQWMLEGTGRAELPMYGNDETVPLGFAVDMTSQYVIPIDETRSIPPMPILYVLSTSGLLCPFYIINVFPNTPGIVKAPEVLSSVGLRRKTVGTKAPSASLTPQNPMVSSAKLSASVTSSRTPSEVPPKSFGNTIPHFNVGIGDKTLASQPSGGIKTGMPLNSIWKVMQPSAAADQSPTLPSLNLTISRSSGTTPFGMQNITKPESVQLTHDKSTKQPVKLPPIKEDFTAAIVEEIRRFNSELGVEMKRRSSEVAVQIGTTEELKTLKGGVESLNEISEEIKKQLLTVQNDVLTLEHSALEAAAILEEMKLCNVRAQDPRLKHLLRQRPLDPVKAKKMRDIVNLFVYIESQIEEVHRTLDQLAEMGKTEKLNLPSMEAVHNVVLNSSLILNGLAEKVYFLVKQTDEMNASRSMRNFTETIEQEKVSDKELASLADSLLRTKITLDATNKGPEMNKTLSQEKVTLLRNFFVNRTTLPKRTRTTDFASRLLSTTPTLMKKNNFVEKPLKEFVEEVTYIREPSPPIAKLPGPVPIMASTPFKFQLNSSFVPVETPEQRSQKSKSSTAGMDNAQPNIFKITAASKGKPQTDVTVGGIQVGRALSDVGERKSTKTTDDTYVCITDIGIPPPTYHFEKSPPSANKISGFGEKVFTVPFKIPSEKGDSDDQLSGEDLDKKLYSASDDDSGSGYEDITPPSSPFEFINEVEYVNEADVVDGVNTETRGEFGSVEPAPTEKEKVTFSFKLPSVASNDKLDAKPAMNLFFNPSNESGFKLNQGITTSFGQGFSAFGTSTVKPQIVVSTSSATIPSTTHVSSPSAQSPLLSSMLSSPKASEPSESTTTQSAPLPIISFSFKQSPSPAITTPATATLPVASVTPVSSVCQTTTVTTPTFGSASATVATIVIPQPKAATASGFSFKSPASSPPPAPAPTTDFTTGQLLLTPTTTQSEVTSPSTAFGNATVTSPVSSRSAANFSFSMSTITSPTPFGQIQPAASTATTVSSPAFATQGFTSTVPFKFESTSSTTSSSVFGQNEVFGQKPATTAFPSTGFGSSTGSAFGQAPAFGLTTSAFGQTQPQQSVVTTSTSVFGQQQQQPATSTALGNLFTSGGTGGFFTGLGGKPAADSAVKNVFGAPTTNAPATSPTPTNLFGSGTTTGILSAKFGGNFSGGNFTVAGAQSVAQTGFGSFQQTSPKPANVGFGSGAFGASATFGGGPKFGSSPTFGGTPSFGATPTGTGGLFGSYQTTQQPNFASFAASATAPTFGSLAAQSPSMSFGTSVPQQQGGTFGAMPQQQQQQPPAFGTTGFGSPQPFGGNSSFGSQGSPSFNQWRS